MDRITEHALFPLLVALLVVSGTTAIGVAITHTGFDHEAATRAAKGHAAVWADEHGFAGPVDCGDIDERWSTARCVVRAARGQPIGAVLNCDATRCVELLPNGETR